MLIHTYICIYDTYVYIYIYIYIFINNVTTHMYPSLYVYTHIHRYTCVCIFKVTHIYIYTSIENIRIYYTCPAKIMKNVKMHVCEKGEWMADAGTSMMAGAVAIASAE